MLRTLLACLLLTTGVAQASADLPEYTLTLRDHRFEPAQLRVPANTKFRLLLVNTDASAEEFESYELYREKVVGANSEVTIFLGPLTPGSYPFVGEYNEATAQGVLIAE